MELRRYIKEKCLTQKEAAAEIGCSERQLNRILNGHPAGIRIRKLLKSWGRRRIDISNLIDGAAKK